MSELTDDQKQSIEKNDQKDLSQDDHGRTETQGETFRERIAETIDGLKESFKNKASNIIETTLEKASDLKYSIQETASNLNKKENGLRDWSCPCSRQPQRYRQHGHSR